MKFSQLEYYCAVAEAENITEAAKRLNITQPALTSSIQRMEAELGVSLFERKGRNVQLSEPGRIVFCHARNILNEWSVMMQKLPRRVAATDHTVRIICATHVLSPKLMGSILRRMPDIVLQIYSPLDEAAFRQFDQGELDLIVNHPMYRTDSIECRELEPDDLVLLSSASCSLPCNSSHEVSLSSLRSYAFASYLERTPLRVEFEALCQAAGFQPKIVLTANTVQEMIPMITSGKVIALVPLRPLEDIHNNDLRIWHLSDIAEMPCLGLSWHADKSMRRCVQIVRDSILAYFGQSI